MSKAILRTMVIVPFSAMPHHVKFRHNRQWWMRRAGTTNYALMVDCAADIYVGQSFKENDLVVTFKKDISKKNHFEIKKEIKV